MAGGFDRLITIEAGTEGQDASGDTTTTWTALASNVWARRTDMGGRERFVAEQRIAVRVAVFRFRWISGVSAKMRIVDADSIAWDVTGIAEDRRAGWMELTAEAINPGGTTV